MPNVEIHPNSTDLIGKVQLPDGYLDLPCRDLLLRLLEMQPKQRLRSLRSLTTIAFYKGYHFEDIKKKKVNSRDLLIKHYGEDYAIGKEQIVSFDGFDEILISE